MTIENHNTAIRYESLLTGQRQVLPPPLNTTFETQTSVAASFQPDRASVTAYLKQHQERLQAKLYEIGPKTQQRLEAANLRIHQQNDKIRAEMAEVSTKISQIQADPTLSPKQKVKQIQNLQDKLTELRRQIKALINFIGITQELEAIINDRLLTKQQKKERIEQIRKAAGLTRREMRELFTGRLEKIYRAATQEVESYQKAVLDNSRTRLKEIKNTQGADSPAAVKLRAEVQAIEATFKPSLQHLEANRSFYGSLYGGKNCIKRTFGAIGSTIGEAFKKAGSFLKKAVSWSPIGILGRIPGIRSLVEPILTAVNKAIDLASQPLQLIKKTAQWTRDFFRNPWQTLKKAGRSVIDLIKKNWRWLTPLALNAIPGVGPALARIARPLIRLYSVGKLAYERGEELYHSGKALVQNAYQTGKQLYASAKTWGKNVWAWMKGTYNDLANAVKTERDSEFTP